EALLGLSQDYGMAFHLAGGEAYATWARGRVGDPGEGARRLRDAIDRFVEQGNKITLPLYYGMLAELEDAAGNPDSALTSLEAAFAVARETGEEFANARLYRLRGEVLMKLSPVDPALAEAAFRGAIEVGHKQGARALALQAALSLAKLYQSIARP